MGCEEIQTNVKLDYIQDFEMIFSRMKIDRPREAAAYYVILVVDNPREFSDFLRVAEPLVNITRRPLEAGRASLLKNGIIAEVLFTSEEEEEKFGRESYLPVPPQVIWDDVKDDLKTVISEDTYNIDQRHVAEINKTYDENFKTYGIKIKRNGNVTLRYSDKWMIYMMLKNCLEKKKQLYLQVGGERLLDSPFLKYLEKFIELESKVKLIIDSKDNLDNAKKLLERYGDKLEIKYFPDETFGTMRNYILGKELAINGIKILNPKEDSEPVYVGTAYVDLENVETLKDTFEGLWKLAKPIQK
ncbi:MAG TPA: hypothetical protein ENI36_03420 [Thermoplasmatales archaeon]|nr:hypothetical protein [Thermoplasmatales archaeon]